uniref:Transmembrane protein n=2 Tax=Brassica oleracea TaxID=3712 RepID=A0A0D3B5E3_BRAOL|nr:unnamed protein product [Brassica oleracea]
MVLRAGLLSVARSNLKGLSFATLWAVHYNLVLRVGSFCLFVVFSSSSSLLIVMFFICF